MRRSDQDKHRRRSIRLKGYDYGSNGAYFVTLCTYDGNCYFTQFPQLYEIVETLWLDIPNKYRHVWLDVYVIMPNHFHAIIGFNDDDLELIPTLKPLLGGVLGSFKSICVNTWLKAIKSQNVDARGKFWQNNYYEHVVRNEEELDRIREYILNNPLHWELDRENPLCIGTMGAMPEKWMV